MNHFWNILTVSIWMSECSEWESLGFAARTRHRFKWMTERYQRNERRKDQKGIRSDQIWEGKIVRLWTIWSYLGIKLLRLRWKYSLKSNEQQKEICPSAGWAISSHSLDDRHPQSDGRSNESQTDNINYSRLRTRDRRSGSGLRPGAQCTIFKIGHFAGRKSTDKTGPGFVKGPTKDSPCQMWNCDQSVDHGERTVSGLVSENCIHALKIMSVDGWRIDVDKTLRKTGAVLKSLFFLLLSSERRGISLDDQENPIAVGPSMIWIYRARPSVDVIELLSQQLKNHFSFQRNFKCCDCGSSCGSSRL